MRKIYEKYLQTRHIKYSGYIIYNLYVYKIDVYPSLVAPAPEKVTNTKICEVPQDVKDKMFEICDSDPYIPDDISQSDGDTKISDLHIWQVAQNKYNCIISLVTGRKYTIEEYKMRLINVHELTHVTIEIHQCKERVT